MSVRTIFRMTALLAFGAGAVWMLAADVVLDSWGVRGDSMTVFLSRQQAALLLAAGLLLWVARESGPSPARRAIFVGGFWAGLFMAFVWLDAVITGVIPSAGVLAVAAGVVIALLFAGAGVSGRPRGDGPNGAPGRGSRGRDRGRGQRSQRRRTVTAPEGRLQDRPSPSDPAEPRKPAGRPQQLAEPPKPPDTAEPR